MKLTQVLGVLKGTLADSVAERYSARARHLTRQDMIDLESVLFAIQDDLEHAPGRKRGADIQVLNDVRNVLLDAAEVNEVRPGAKHPHVERMRKKIVGWV